MSTVSGVRMSTFCETFLNDLEQDANSVLTELDKGLRSTKLGVQCEAIVRFPRLFEKYPFRILINSSFLKLAEFFLNGSNLLRFWVLRVCQQSENHLDKILNIDAFVKRIFMVIHSNDPVARALTLRTLGAVSRIIPEKQQVHHALRKALDSHDVVEVEAAIDASAQFAAQSRSFAISMCTKISDMIESLQIPVPMKLQLIPVLRHMHHDANTAAIIRKVCLNLLPKYPSKNFVVAILISLTELSSKTLTDIPHQVNLLLEFIDDSRAPVRYQALKSLYKLADRKCMYAWPKYALSIILNKGCCCTDKSQKYLFLSILKRLFECQLTCNLLLKQELESTIIHFCKECLCLRNVNAAKEVIRVLVTLVSYSDQSCNIKELKAIMNLIEIHLQALLVYTVPHRKYAKNFCQILQCGVQLANINLNFGRVLVTTLANLLNESKNYPVVNVVTICETLGALCSIFQLHKFSYTESECATQDAGDSGQTNPVLKYIRLILHKLTTTAEAKCSANTCNKILEILSAVALQAMMGCFIPQSMMRIFENVIRNVNAWTQYRIGRSASRYGHHYLAAHIYLRISRLIVVDKLRFFLDALAQIAQAECILNYGVTYEFMHENYELYERHVVSDVALEGSMTLMEKLEITTNLYWQSLATLRASTSPNNTFTFQLEFLKLRAQFLQILHSAVTIKIAQIIVPPPAIADSLAQNSRDPLQKFGHVTNQLRKLVKEMKTCEESFFRLYKSAFDADPTTLEFLEIIQHQCGLITYIVETICYFTPSDKPTLSIKGKSPSTKYLVRCYHRLKELGKGIPDESTNNKIINNTHLDIIIAEIEIITKTPLCLPRFFFQVLQSTQIKLSISPQPRNDSKPVNVQCGSNLVIKVEGVIQHYGRKPSMFRSVDSVQLSLVSKLLQSPRPTGENIKFTNDTVTLTQIVKPQRDFLSGNFLVPISAGGHWQVTLETYVIDENDITWCTGPKTTMMVRVLDDPIKSQTTSNSSTSIRRF